MYDPHPTHNLSPQQRRSPRRCRPLRRWYWQVVVAVLLAVLVVEGQPVAVAASQASAAAQGRAARWAQRSQQTAGQLPGQAATVPAGSAFSEAASAAEHDRPDLRVSFAPLDDVQAGQPFRATLRVQNDGASASAASVSALVPPGMSNVRVTAPGFVCTRHFTASGPDAGTVVACSRSDLDQGAAAEVTIEANAPSGPGRYQMTALADPRDDVTEANEANNDARLSVEVQS